MRLPLRSVRSIFDCYLASISMASTLRAQVIGTHCLPDVPDANVLGAATMMRSLHFTVANYHSPPLGAIVVLHLTPSVKTS